MRYFWLLKALRRRVGRGRMVSYSEVIQKRAARKSMDDLPEADFFPGITSVLPVTQEQSTTSYKSTSRYRSACANLVRVADMIGT